MLSIFSINATANPILTTTHLERGDVAPYHGYLLTEETTEKVQKDLVRKDYLEKENSSLKTSLQFQQMEIESFERSEEIYRNENKKLKTQNKYEKWIYLGLGVLGTSLAVYGAGQLR